MFEAKDMYQSTGAVAASSGLQQLSSQQQAQQSQSGSIATMPHSA